MLAVQHRLPLAPSRLRSVRRAFHPSQGTEPYRLPHDIRDRLAASLAPFRNREAAFALAVFLARFWSVPGRVALGFPIDRRALVEHQGLALTEKRIRTAIATLEAIGFLDRALTSGSTYKPTEHGLRKKPVKFTFGSDYAPMFLAANGRAAAARGRQEGVRRSHGPAASQRPSAANFQGSNLNGPKSRISSERSVIMGHLVKENGIPPKAFVPDANLEAALERLRQGFSASRGSGNGGAR